MLKKSCLIGLVLGAVAQQSMAGSGSGTIGLTIELTPACAITSSTSPFAALDFGQIKSQWDSAIHASTDALLNMVCSDGVSEVTVAIDGGVRGDRTLYPDTCTGTCDAIAYRVFRDIQRTVEYEIGVPQAFAIPATALGDDVSLSVPLYGAISPGTASAWGSYSDTLVVTIDFN